MDAVGDHQRLVAHPARLAHPFHLGVQPQIRVSALQGPLAEDPDLLIEAAAQPHHLVLAQVVQAHLLDQPVDLAGGDPVDIGLLHHRDQRLLGAPARLQKRREVAAVAQLGDGQLDAADPSVPVAGPVAVAVGGPLQAALAQLRANPGADLGVHQLGSHPGHRLAQHIGVLTGQQLVGKLGSGHPGPFGHRGVSFVALREQTDDHEARGGRTHIRPASLATPLSATRPASAWPTACWLDQQPVRPQGAVTPHSSAARCFLPGRHRPRPSPEGSPPHVHLGPARRWRHRRR